MAACEKALDFEAVTVTVAHPPPDLSGPGQPVADGHVVPSSDFHIRSIRMILMIFFWLKTCLLPSLAGLSLAAIFRMSDHVGVKLACCLVDFIGLDSTGGFFGI